MVQHVETLAGIFKNRGLPKPTQDLAIEFGQKLREIGAPEVIEGVTILDANASKYEHPNFIHDRNLRTVQLREGSAVKRLSRTENKLLIVLEERPNNFVSSAELVKRVFDEGHSVGYLRKYVLRLRQKMEPKSTDPEFIISARGQGYMLKDPSKVYSYAGFMYYPERSSVEVGGQETVLTATENKVLGLLALYGNRIVTHEMFGELWEDIGSVGTLRSVVQRLRSKIEPDKRGRDNQYILSLYGIGYKLYDPEILKASSK